DYWGGKIDMDRWIMRPIPETAPRIAALLKGEVDVITQLPPDQEDRVAANPSTRVAGALYAGLYVLAVNSKRPPLDNPLVKQALSLAIDREAIVKELWRGRGIVPSGPIAKGDNPFDPSLPPLAYKPAEARERLKKAGYKGEEVFIETTVAYVSQDKAMSEAIAAMWKDVSVNEKFRGQAYKEMTKIFLEHFPWIPVIQPYEDYGVQKYVEFAPNPNQQFEIRRFNFKFRRA